MAITPLPTPPQRTDRANFRARADAFVSALPTFGDEANALALTVEGYKDDAETAVTNAQGQVALAEGQVTLAVAARAGAEDARDTAMSSANFQGAWTASAYTVPSSVSHDGGLWLLLENASDVEVPGVSAKWLDITPGGGSASEIDFTPAGDVSATTVQAAIEELDGEKEPDLGTPGTDGYVLSSTTAGVRSWVEQTGSLAISDNHFFADNSDRDVYFATNPGELIEGVFVSVGDGYQQYDGTDWINKTAVVRGPQGDKGDTGDITAELEAARDTALAGANFKGIWSDLAGALNMPASVAHDEKFWALAANLADVTLAEPGVSTSWVEIVTGAGALPIGLPDWPATLTRTDGVLTEAVYANGAIRYRQQLNRTNGELTSVLYSRSTDSGATWTDIGTETLNRTDGELTGTSWADA